MQKMPLSVRFNKALPYLLLTGGLLSLLLMGKAVSYAVGWVLIAAGIFEWTRRFRAKDSAGAPSTSPRPPDNPQPQRNLMLMHWRDVYECGHPIIDTQHQELFNVGNDLINAALDHTPKVGMEYLLHELVEHIRDHFHYEEEVLARTGYPQLIEHQAIHRGLLNRAVELEQRCRAGMLPMPDLVGFVAYDVIAAHIIHDDLKFALKERPFAHRGG